MHHPQATGSNSFFLKVLHYFFLHSFVRLLLYHDICYNNLQNYTIKVLSQFILFLQIFARITYKICTIRGNNNLKKLLQIEKLLRYTRNFEHKEYTRWRYVIFNKWLHNKTWRNKSTFNLHGKSTHKWSNKCRNWTKRGEKYFGKYKQRQRKKGEEMEQKLNSRGYNRVLRYKATCSERFHIEANQVIQKRYVYSVENSKSGFCIFYL